MSTGKQKENSRAAGSTRAASTSQVNPDANVNPSTTSVFSNRETGLSTMTILHAAVTLINQGIEDGGYGTLFSTVKGEDAELAYEIWNLTEQFVILHYQYDRPLAENKARREYLREQYRKVMRKKEDFQTSEQERAAANPQMVESWGWNRHLLRMKLLTMFARIVTQEMVLACQRFDVVANKGVAGANKGNVEQYERQAAAARAKLDDEGKVLTLELAGPCRALLGMDVHQASDRQNSEKERLVAVRVGPQVVGPTDKPVLRTETGDHEVDLVSWEGSAGPD